MTDLLISSFFFFFASEQALQYRPQQTSGMWWMCMHAYSNYVEPSVYGRRQSACESFCCEGTFAVTIGSLITNEPRQ